MAQRQLSDVNFRLEEGRRLLEDDERVGLYDQDDDVESNPDEDQLAYSPHDTQSEQSFTETDDSEEDPDWVPAARAPRVPAAAAATGPFFGAQDGTRWFMQQRPRARNIQCDEETIRPAPRATIQPTNALEAFHLFLTDGPDGMLSKIVFYTNKKLVQMRESYGRNRDYGRVNDYDEIKIPPSELNIVIIIKGVVGIPNVPFVW